VVKKIQHKLAALVVAVLIGIVGPWFLRTLEELGLYRATDCTLERVSDGDTVRATCGGEKIKIRLHCLDAPEMQQKPWGRKSRNHLKAILPRAFELKTYDTDRYGRTVGEILDPASRENVNLRMVREGQAAIYRRYCDDPRYPQAERHAKDARGGIWGEAGLHQRPWAYRHR